MFDYFLDGSVRLVDGSSSSEGRVEVYYQGAWGTVCDDLFDIPDATVICRQLGFPSAVRAVSAAAEFSVGDGPIFLDNLECTGDESKLSDCTHTGWTVNNCRHSEDAGVVCSTATAVPGVPGNKGVFHLFCSGSLKVDNCQLNTVRGYLRIYINFYKMCEGRPF